MKRIFLSIIALVLTTAALVPVGAQQAATKTQQKVASTGANAPAGVDVDKIVRAFTTKESVFRKALNEYSFKRDAVVQTIGLGGQISGEFHRISRFVFDDAGNRFEKILFAPMPTITEIQLTPADFEDLGGIQPFALEASKAYLYDFKYVGRERIDELNLYIFDVAPKVLPVVKKNEAPKERFFLGRIWVDEQDLQIVKARGKGVPEGRERFPTFETYREQIDGRFWFPTYTFADDELVFDTGQVVHLRLRVRYTDFERLKGRVIIVDEGDPGVVDEKDDKQPTPTPTPAKPKP